METAATEPQVEALAIKLKGEVNWAPVDGVVTVMADAGTQIPRSIKEAESKVFMDEPRVVGEHA
jgi:hypothetical protein